jgi:hypothetical protein
LRLVVPDIGAYVAAYQSGDTAFFAKRAAYWPDAAEQTRLEQVLSYAGAGAVPGDLGAHKFGYDFETLAVMLQRAGFAAVERCGFNGSRHLPLRIDHTSAAATITIDGRELSLFVEASAIPPSGPAAATEQRRN